MKRDKDAGQTSSVSPAGRLGCTNQLQHFSTVKCTSDCHASISSTAVPVVKLEPDLDPRINQILMVARHQVARQWGITWPTTNASSQQPQLLQDIAQQQTATGIH